MKKWVVPEVDKKNASRISKAFNIPVLPAVLLDVKHFKSDDEMLEFLSEDAEFSDPFLIADMDAAVERINRAIDNYEKICVYGDYDADGVTSTAIMYSYLENVSAYVMYYIPSRENEGYGLNKGAIDLLKEKGIGLIITVDNGISAYNEVEYANSLGIDVIVTDHHTPPERIPNAAANINPHRIDDKSPFKDFSGVGVAFKLIMALEAGNLEAEDLLDLYSDICAVGTIADVVSLTGENRILVREGLKRLNNNVRPGLEVLRSKIGYEGKYVSSVTVAFNIAPKINACGRLNTAEAAVKLLLTEDYEEAETLANELLEQNADRKKIESEILAEAIKTIDENPDIKNRRILVVEGEDWHHGVAGLVAARVKEIYGKPTIIISYNGAVARGSGRSVEGFALCDAITYCKDLLTYFGGHPMAAGLTLPTENIDTFREKINEYADSLTNTFFPKIYLSCKLNPANVSLDMARSLPYLEPYGTDNPSPIFGFYDVTLCATYPLSGGKHLKLFISRNSPEVQVLYFNVTPEDFPYVKGDRLNLAVTLEVNNFNGNSELSVFGKDICFAGVDYEELLRSKQLFEDYIMGKPVTPKMKSELSVTRDDFVIVYKFLKVNKGFDFGADILHYRINHKNISYGKLMLIIEAMKELNLITSEPSKTKLNIRLVENPPKVNILSAPILTNLM